MNNLILNYSNGLKLNVWNNLLSNEEEGNVYLGYSTPNPEPRNYTFERVENIAPSPFLPKKEQGYYDLDIWDLVESNVPSLRTLEEKELVSIAEMVELAKKVFGLSVVQVAEILKVSRPSLYNHVSGKDSPKDSSSYKALFATASRVNVNVTGSLKPGLKNIFVDGKTLLRHLKDSYEDAEVIEKVATLVAEKLVELNQGPRSIPSGEQQKAVLAVGKSG